MHEGDFLTLQSETVGMLSTAAPYYFYTHGFVA